MSMLNVDGLQLCYVVFCFGLSLYHYHFNVKAGSLGAIIAFIINYKNSLIIMNDCENANAIVVYDRQMHKSL